MAEDIYRQDKKIDIQYQQLKDEPAQIVSFIKNFDTQSNVIEISEILTKKYNLVSWNISHKRTQVVFKEKEPFEKKYYSGLVIETSSAGYSPFNIYGSIFLENAISYVNGHSWKHSSTTVQVNDIEKEIQKLEKDLDNLKKASWTEDESEIDKFFHTNKFEKIVGLKRVSRYRPESIDEQTFDYVMSLPSMEMNESATSQLRLLTGEFYKKNHGGK